MMFTFEIVVYCDAETTTKLKMARDLRIKICPKLQLSSRATIAIFHIVQALGK